jgi:hypothetical protein
VGEQLLLPQGSVLLHIGPHKTGTTTIQGALSLARPALLEHGVHYPGQARQHQSAALSITGGKGLIGDDRPISPKVWQRLVSQVAAAPDDRVVVSSEFFDDADDTTANLIVTDLGGPRVHVVVTLRPLALILPSAWQQYVRNKLRTSYDDWLEAMFNQPPYIKPTTTFWKRHHHDVLIGRWARIVGPDNVTVIVVDESDHDRLLRVFEELLGLPTGLLVAEESRTNRSLTLGETELVRAVNVGMRTSGWPKEIYHQLIRYGAVERMQVEHLPTPDEPRLTTPEWALKRAAEFGADAAQAIDALGVRVVGDLKTLGTYPSRAVRDDNNPAANDPRIQPGVAATALLGVIAAAERERESTEGRAPTHLPDTTLTSREMLVELAVRGRARARRTAKSARRRIRVGDVDEKP